MKKKLEGFISLVVLFLIATMTVFLLVNQRLLWYAHSLAHENALTLQERSTRRVTTKYVVTLIKNRFQELNHYLATTGKPHTQMLCLPELTTCQMTITQNNAQQLTLLLTYKNMFGKEYISTGLLEEKITDQTTGKKTVVLKTFTSE